MAGKRARVNGGRTQVTKRTKKTWYPKRQTTASFDRRVIADTTLVKLVYVDRYQIAPVAGAIVHQVMRGNSIFDPDFTNVGHQPAGRDEWAAFYKHYQVQSSSIKIEVVPGVTGVGAASAELALCPSVTSGDFTATDPEVVRENPLSQMLLISGGIKAPAMNAYMTTTKMVGQGIYDNTTSGALMTTNPSAQWFWHILVQAIDESTTLDMWMYVTVTYYTKLMQRLPLANS